MAALTHVSSSQVKDFIACNRLWFYTRILKERPPQTEAQSRGTTVHGALEAHLKAGVIEPEILERAKTLGISEKDLSDYVAAMQPFVGKPGEGLTEFRDEMPTYDGGPKYVLVVDHAREINVEGHGVIPQIDDLKTTSDFRYCKTPDELSKDVQMVSYAKWALWRLFALKNLTPPGFVSLRHVYVRTRGKRVATARDVLVTAADVEARWAEILDRVRDMELLAATHATSKIDPQDVPATTVNHCSAYGGCFFRAQCFGAVYDTGRPFMGLFNKEKKEMIMADTNGVAPTGPRMSLRDRMALKSGAPAAPVAPVAPAVAPVAPAVTVAPVASAPAITSSVCGATHPMMPQAPCTLVKHEGDHESKNAAGGVVHWSWDNAKMGMGPSADWKPIVAAPATAPVAPPATTAVAAVASFAASTQEIPAVLPPDAPARTSTPEEVAAAGTSKRGRPKKSVEAAPAAPPVTTIVAGAGLAAAPAAPAAPAAAPAAAPSSTPNICTLKELYIDAWPVKGIGSVPGLGEDLLHGLAADAAKAANLPDWRLVEFGKGKGAMAVLLRERLGTVPEVLVVTSSTPGSDVLIEVLSPHAKRVVRALRG